MIDQRPHPNVTADDADEEVRPESDRFAPEQIRDSAVIIEKRCRVCGKDLNGQKRYKDSRGYWCPECDEQDKLGRVNCGECGRPVPADSLVQYGPTLICGRCNADHLNDPKGRLLKKRVSTRKFEEHEKRNLLILGGIFAFLLLLVILSWTGVIGL